MEKQIEKFARLCDVFNFRVYDNNSDYVRVEKGQFQMLIGKYLLSNDYHLIRTLLKVYSEFREYEQNRKLKRWI